MTKSQQGDRPVLGKMAAVGAEWPARRGRASIALALLIVACLGGALTASGADNPSPPALLSVHISGGDAADPAVTITPAPLEAEVDQHPCRRLIDPCEYTVSAGSVTLSATPTTTPIQWSDPACGTSHECQITAEAGERTSIVAIFMPVSLTIQMAGEGQDGDGVVRVTPIDCTGANCSTECVLTRPDPPNRGTTFCTYSYPKVTEVDVEAIPDPDYLGVNWDGLCQPPAGQLITRCEVGLSGLPVRVGFGGAQPDTGFLVGVNVRVLRQGSGGGRVIGTAHSTRDENARLLVIDCPPDCSESTRYATRLTLTARDEDDSTFERWLNVCSANRTCEFSAGATTVVRAVFRRQEPPSHTTTVRETTTNTVPDTTTNTVRETTTQVTTTTDAVVPQRTLAARVIAVSVVRARGRWIVIARLTANRPTRVRAEVVRASRRIAAWAGRLPSGRSALRLPLRPSVVGGTARLSVTLRSPGSPSKTLRARFRIPNRR